MVKLKTEAGFHKNYHDYRTLAEDLNSEIQLIKKQLFLMKKEFLNILDQSSVAAAFLVFENGILYYNFSFARLTGLKRKEEAISISELPVFGPILSKMNVSSQTIQIGSMQIEIQKVFGENDCFFILMDKYAFEKKEREKKYITSAIWHEIKTPLTVIKGYTQLLLEEVKEPEIKHICRKIEFQVERLEKVTSQLRSLSHLEVGQNQTINVQDFIDMIHQTLEAWRSDIGDLQLQVQSNFDEVKQYVNESLEIHRGDAFIIISNLISNAIRFNFPKGSIEISLLVQHNMLVFEVWNTGPGIPQDMKEVILKPFGYSSISGEKSKGVGLYLVKEAVERGGGRITIDIDTEQRTRVRIFNPFR